MGRPKKVKEVKEVKAEVVAVEQVKDGTFKGEYSTSLYNNGELISFDIDWDMLKKHVQSATVGYK